MVADRTRIAPIGVAPPPELDELGRSLRTLMERVLVVDRRHPELHADLDWARRTLDEVAERLARHGRAGRAVRIGVEGDDPQARPYYVRGPLIGAHHPMAPVSAIETRDGVTRGSVNFGVAFEGPPSCVHGGFVAFFFDIVLGHHNIALELPAMTGTLTVRYRRPTPLLTDLAFEARITRAEGRKLVTSGWLADAEGRVAEAEGLFVLPQGADFRAYLDRVTRGEPGEPDPD
jgi:acyl-coenzyme A thioesterase PaaI-like protein